MPGIDLPDIHGLGPSLALKLIGDCGADLRAWPSAKHFTSWLCLAPRTLQAATSSKITSRRIPSLYGAPVSRVPTRALPLLVCLTRCS
ncbi:IS110 family transposase [Bradyrhizobium sp. 145]|uniref:IS110 family transposase n=1 Tax=Bradyrhizobium sp. 145 TaxID=2782621 RepID=UPI001FF8D642